MSTPCWLQCQSVGCTWRRKHHIKYAMLNNHITNTTQRHTKRHTKKQHWLSQINTCQFNRIYILSGILPVMKNKYCFKSSLKLTTEALYWGLAKTQVMLRVQHSIWSNRPTLDLTVTISGHFTLVFHDTVCRLTDRVGLSGPRAKNCLQTDSHKMSSQAHWVEVEGT